MTGSRTVPLAAMISLLMVLSALPTAFFESIDGADSYGMEETGMVVRVDDTEYPLYSGYSPIITVDDYPYYYSDGFFAEDPHIFSDRLAALSAFLATTSLPSAQNFSEQPASVLKMLKDMGFSDAEANRDYKTKPTEHTLGFAYGSKTVVIDGEEVRLNAIVFRGMNYQEEWINNLTIGKEYDMEGISSTVKTVAESFTDRLDAGDMFWITGFSRGGMAAELLTKDLISYGLNTNGEDVSDRFHTYAFEAPASAGFDPEEKGCFAFNPKADYGCIHVVVNSSDMIGKIIDPSSELGHYGTVHSVFDPQAPGFAIKRAAAIEVQEKMGDSFAKIIQWCLELESADGIDPVISDEIIWFMIEDGEAVPVMENGQPKKTHASVFVDDFLDAFYSETGLDREFYTDHLQDALITVVRLAFTADGTDGIDMSEFLELSFLSEVLITFEDNYGNEDYMSELLLMLISMVYRGDPIIDQEDFTAILTSINKFLHYDGQYGYMYFATLVSNIGLIVGNHIITATLSWEIVESGLYGIHIMGGGTPTTDGLVPENTSTATDSAIFILAVVIVAFLAIAAYLVKKRNA